MSYWSGKSGALWWSYFNGTVSDDDWSAFLEFSRLSYTQASRGDVIMTVPYHTSTPTPLMRKNLGALISETAKDNPIARHAFVTDSKLTYAVNTAINWLSKKPYIERIFDEPMEALLWLNRYHTGVDPEAARRDIHSKVSAGKLWDRFG